MVTWSHVVTQSPGDSAPISRIQSRSEQRERSSRRKAVYLTRCRLELLLTEDELGVREGPAEAP